MIISNVKMPAKYNSEIYFLYHKNWKILNTFCKKKINETFPLFIVYKINFLIIVTDSKFLTQERHPTSLAPMRFHVSLRIRTWTPQLFFLSIDHSVLFIWINSLVCHTTFDATKKMVCNMSRIRTRFFLLLCLKKHAGMG